MPSNFTENYQLSQWEATDPVLRTDFNADNAKIDAALHTLDTSLSALNTSTTQALRGKLSSSQHIEIQNGIGQTSGVTISFPQNEQWGDWDAVCAFISYPDVPADTTLALRLLKDVDYTSQKIQSIGSPAYLLVLFPRRSADSYVWGFIIADRVIPVTTEYSFRQIAAISAQASKLVASPDIRLFGWK